MHGEGRAVAALADHDAADADDAPLAGLQVAFQVAVMLRAEGLGHQQADIAAGDLVHRIAEQALGGGAERFDQPMLVDHDHGVRHRLQDGTQSRLGGFQRGSRR